MCIIVSYYEEKIEISKGNQFYPQTKMTRFMGPWKHIYNIKELQLPVFIKDESQSFVFELHINSKLYLLKTLTSSACEEMLHEVYTHLVIQILGNLCWIFWLLVKLRLLTVSPGCGRNTLPGAFLEMWAFLFCTMLFSKRLKSQWFFCLSNSPF